MTKSPIDTKREIGAVANAPRRIQRKRTKGWRMPPNTVYVGRGTAWGNPYTVAKHGRKEAVTLYAAIFNDGRGLLRMRRELRGKNLACFCPLDQPCHADVLLELANAPSRSGAAS